jgi:diguanylate cyclase
MNIGTFMQSSTGHLCLAAGVELFHEGEAGTVAYLVKRGRVQIFVTRDGLELPLAVRRQGEIVGEMAIIDHRPRSASARVLEDCELVVLTASQLASRIDNADPILRMCLAVVIDRYRETVGMLNHRNVFVEYGQQSRASSDVDFQAAVDLLVLERELRDALERGEFELFYQPIVRLRSGRLCGFEALMRWRHPERGVIAPGVFIPVAEASGLIVEMTRWCLEEVGRSIPELMTAALTNVENVEPLTLSVNISGCDLSQPTFAASVVEILAAAGVDPGCIKLEVTETMLMNNPANARAMLGACRDHGMGIAIDDFGTGFSSLSQLSTLPITTLKIDRSFVHSMSGDPTRRRIVHTILGLAEELGLSVVAEGIEEVAEALELNSMGCAFGQGYLFGRPVDLAASRLLVRNWRATQEDVAVPMMPRAARG